MKKVIIIFKLNSISMFFLFCCFFGAINNASGVAYTVNLNSDNGTSSTATSGDLRFCITTANATAGPHTISFAPSITNIVLTGELPVFTRQITLQATPGSVVINGNNIRWCFLFNNAAGTGSIIDGLVINNAGANYSNVEINGVNGITIRNCYIGTNAAGNAAAAANPLFGVLLINASNNFITNNVISGHAQHGLLINNTSSGNTVRGNKIGCNLLGTAAIPNGFHGIEINNGSINNIIGGPNAVDRNIISGNPHIGITIVGNSTGTQITNNYIGVNLTGDGAIPNGEHGIMINASGSAVVTNNVVSGNLYYGLHILDSDGHVFRGNKVGVNAAGTAAIPNTFIGLRISNSDNLIIGGGTAGEGNTLSGNGEEGLRLIDCASPTLRGNFIGTNSTGTAALSNGRSGVHMQNCPTATIGGTTAGQGNTVSGNTWDGFQIESSPNAVIQGNFIGTNATGTGAIGNGSNGIAGYTNSTGHLIGGTVTGARNIISGNGIDGIHYDGIAGACNNLLVKNNYIGTDVNGAGAAATFGNGKSGVVVLNNCLGLIIGGTTAIERNIISGNGRLWGNNGNGSGIVINGGCTGAQIINNYIGLAVNGSTAMGNAENGIVIVYSNNVVIGGNNSTLRNLISSNGRQGVVLSADPNTQITGSIIIGNYIGTDITGTLPRGNGQSGIISIFGSNGFLGRANADEGNLISNNQELGIHLVGGSGNTAYNNLIGVAADGTTAMGNWSGGVYIQGVAAGTNGSNNTIGGLAARQPNTIAYSTGTGVNPDLGNGFGIGVAHNEQGINNKFIGNKIFCNAGLGIDLNFAGAFGGGANAPGNGGKAAPAITSVTFTSTTGTGINGETIHVYANETCITCQGKKYLGSAVVAGGVWTVTHESIPTSYYNSATATNNTLGTSQFSCNFALPVELLFFKAQAQGEKVLLTWGTSTEHNNAGFVIERSKDGKSFEAVDYVHGQGNSLTLSNYSFIDEKPYNGISYYRLKQVDFDGTHAYTSIQTVRFETVNDVFLFPNPATDELNVIVTSDELYNVHVYSNLGVEVATIKSTYADNTYTIQLNGIASGSYILELRSATNRITKPFLVY